MARPIMRACLHLTLTPAERKDLRGQAHHLDPVVLVGGDGLTPPC